MTRNKIMFIFSLLIFGILIRLMPYFVAMMNVNLNVHSFYLPWSLSPLTGIFLVTGAVYATRFSFLVPIFILFVCDVGIYFFTGKIEYTGFVFNPTLHVTYLTMIIIALFGKQFLRRYSYLSIIGTGVAAELMFFFVTNGATWWFGTIYEHTFAGFMTCLAAGVPLAIRLTISTLIYAPAIFYAYHYICMGETTLIPKINRIEAKTI